MRNISNFKRSQEGATLMTVMVFLVLMTIVTISATKMSILDILVSGNDQERILTYQETANNLTALTQIDILHEVIRTDGFNNALNQYQTKDSTNETTRLITDMNEKYPCERMVLGSSMGGGAPSCALYDFQIKTNKNSTGAREEQHRGAGKMAPDSKSKFSLI